MILVTGASGFIGKVLVRHLVENDYPVRILLRPSRRSPDLPRGISLEVAVSSLSDERGLRAALVGVDTIYHLASVEWYGTRFSLLENDILGTQAICQAAVEARVERLFFVSHLGADRASAYPALKAKAISEEYIRRSGMNYTILRSGIVFGNHDHFTSGLAQLLSAFPFIFLAPGDGKNLLQPLWVEDLATCLVWALDNQDVSNQTISIGGPEFITLNQIVQNIQDVTGLRRSIIHLHPTYLHMLTLFLETIFPGLPVSAYWLDYMAANRTCNLDTIPRLFNLLPSRFSHRLDHLRSYKRIGMFQKLFRRPGR